MLNIGINSYSSIEQADQYIEQQYPRYDPLRVIWSVLTEDEKESYLRQSLAEIETLPFVGRRCAVGQALQFPRSRSNVYMPRSFPWACVVETRGIPGEVVNAQIENALGVLKKKCGEVSDRQFKTMQSLGAMRNLKYDKREAGDFGYGADATAVTKSNTPLSSLSAYSYLRPWLGALRG